MSIKVLKTYETRLKNSENEGDNKGIEFLKPNYKSRQRN